jgi:hypothetical protein
MHEYESDPERPGEASAPLGETEVMEAAAELFEMDEIGAFVRRIFARTGRQLQRTLVPAAADALARALQPVADGIAQVLAPDQPSPPAINSDLGLELEGLSAEDREFEVAKQLVRLASTAAAIAGSAPPNVPVGEVARIASVEAAKQFAPGFVGRLSSGPGPNRAPAQPPLPSSGRWYRRGDQIVLVGI